MTMGITTPCRDGCNSCSSQHHDIPAPVSTVLLCSSLDIPRHVNRSPGRTWGAPLFNQGWLYREYLCIHQSPCFEPHLKLCFQNIYLFSWTHSSIPNNSHSLPHYLGWNHRPFSTHKPHHPTSTALHHNESCQARSVLFQPCVHSFLTITIMVAQLLSLTWIIKIPSQLLFPPPSSSLTQPPCSPMPDEPHPGKRSHSSFLPTAHPSGSLSPSAVALWLYSYWPPQPWPRQGTDPTCPGLFSILGSHRLRVRSPLPPGCTLFLIYVPSLLYYIHPEVGIHAWATSSLPSAKHSSTMQKFLEVTSHNTHFQRCPKLMFQP